MHKASVRTAHSPPLYAPANWLRDSKPKPHSLPLDTTGWLDSMRSGEVSVFGIFFLFLVLFFLVLVFVHRLQFDRIGHDHLEVCAALRAGDDLALIDFIFIDVEISLAFRTIHHDFLRFQDTLIYLVSWPIKSSSSVKCSMRPTHFTGTSIRCLVLTIGTAFLVLSTPADAQPGLSAGAPDPRIAEALKQ